MSVNLSVSSWAPVGESELDLLIERIQLDAGTIGGVGFGIFVAIWTTCVYYHVKGKSFRQLPFGTLAYLVGLFVGLFVYLAANTRWVELMFIDYRNFHLAASAAYDPTIPENVGPLGFYNYDYNTPVSILGNTMYAFVNFLADGLVLYRCYLIWNYNHLVMALPTLIFLASTALSILTVWNNSQTTAEFVGVEAVNFVLSWTILSLCLNIILTLMIVGRLLAARNRLIHVLGRQHARLYTSIAAMVVESAAIQAVFAVLFLIFFRMPGPAGQFFNVILSPMTYSLGIAPTLILLRVAHGRAYSKDTAVASATGVRPTNKTGPMITLNATSTRSSSVNVTGDVWQHGVEKHEESVASYV